MVSGRGVPPARRLCLTSSAALTARQHLHVLEADRVELAGVQPEVGQDRRRHLVGAHRRVDLVVDLVPEHDVGSVHDQHGDMRVVGRKAPVLHGIALPVATVILAVLLFGGWSID